MAAALAGRLKGARPDRRAGGRIIGRFKVGTHFVRTIAEHTFSYQRKVLSRVELAWAPRLFRDEEPAIMENPAAPAQQPAAALTKARTQRPMSGDRRVIFQELLPTWRRNNDGQPRHGMVSHGCASNCRKPNPIFCARE